MNCESLASLLRHQIEELVDSCSMHFNAHALLMHTINLLDEFWKYVLVVEICWDALGNAS